MLQQILDPLMVVHVGFAQEHAGQKVRTHLTAFHQRFQRGVIVALWRVVESFVVVWISAALQQQARQFCVVGNSRSSIQSRFELMIFILAPEAGIRISARIE